MYTHSNYWGGYSEIIGGIYPPSPPCFGTPGSRSTSENLKLSSLSVNLSKIRTGRDSAEVNRLFVLLQINVPPLQFIALKC